MIIAKQRYYLLLVNSVLIFVSAGVAVKAMATLASVRHLGRIVKLYVRPTLHAYSLVWGSIIFSFISTIIVSSIKVSKI